MIGAIHAASLRLPVHLISDAVPGQERKPTVIIPHQPGCTTQAPHSNKKALPYAGKAVAAVCLAQTTTQAGCSRKAVTTQVPGTCDQYTAMVGFADVATSAGSSARHLWRSSYDRRSLVAQVTPRRYGSPLAGGGNLLPKQLMLRPSHEHSASILVWIFSLRQQLPRGAAPSRLHALGKGCTLE